MPRLNSANNAQTTLGQNIISTDVSFSVVDASLFPAAPFRITIDSEIMEVGTVDTTNNVFSNVTRGEEGTTAMSHNSGATIENRFTAGTYAEMVSSDEIPVTSVNNKTGAITLGTGDVGAEPAFTKNTAFNKNFGGTGTATTVSRSDHNHTGTYEPAFTKNTAFNKNFGGTGTATTVSRSDHSHTAAEVGAVSGSVKLTVSANAPSNPAVNDIWIQI